MQHAFEDWRGDEQRLIIRLSKEELDAQLAAGVVDLPDGARFRVGVDGYSDREIGSAKTTSAELQAADPNDQMILGWLSLTGVAKEYKALGRTSLPNGPLQKAGRLLGQTIRHQFAVSWTNDK